MTHKLNADSLLEGCIKGERKSQELLYRSFASKMFGVCIRYAKDNTEAEDILQSGFIKVFKKLAEFRGDGSLEGWIRRIMVNTAIETYRKNKRSLHVIDAVQVNDEPQQGVEMTALETKDLLNLIKQLPDGYRMVFNMYVIEGYSHKEISMHLGITEGASKSQLSRARAILRQRILKEEDYNYATHVG